MPLVSTPVCRKKSCYTVKQSNLKLEDTPGVYVIQTLAVNDHKSIFNRGKSTLLGCFVGLLEKQSRGTWCEVEQKCVVMRELC